MIDNIEELKTKEGSGISPAEYRYIELKGYRSSVDDVPEFGIKKGWQCMNCSSMVYLNKCPDDECYNFYEYVNYTSDRAMDKEFWQLMYKQHPELKENDNE